MLVIKDLSKKFKTGDIELNALKDISFTIPTGQFLAITGRSGAGKSTLLYNISLLDTPSSGSITIDGEDITLFENHHKVTYRLHHFGFIFQDYALLPTLTALENVMLPLLMQGKTETEASKKGEQALEKVGLGEKIHNLPSQLSGGQQQRVSIARSIVHNPKILFADEPTANLDTESSKTVLDIFLELNNNANLTIVMVTHELEYAKLADRTISLLDGKIISDISQKKSEKKTSLRK